MSLLLPPFAAAWTDPEIKRVLIVGTGGGFDFVHALTIVPELKRLGKELVFASYSFGVVHSIKDASIVFDADRGAMGELAAAKKRVRVKKKVRKKKEKPAADDDDDDNDGSEKEKVRKSDPGRVAPHAPMTVKLVTAKSQGNLDYQPEVGFVKYMDAKHPDSAPHSIYASYAREWTIGKLSEFYALLVDVHDVDAVICFDGGTDSLMRGDEAGLGDPIEDAVTVAAVSQLDVKLKQLICIGFGCDRFNGVSDGASMRAVAELTATGGFLGTVSLTKDSEPFKFYRAGLDAIYSEQTFRSVLSGAVTAAANGLFGFQIPAELRSRVRSNKLFIWPLMAQLWAFCPVKVTERSLTIDWLRDAEHVGQNQSALNSERNALGKADKLRPIENIPSQEELILGLKPNYG